MICNINAFKSSRFPNLFMAMFQSPKSGHIVCNDFNVLKGRYAKKFKSPKSKIQFKNFKNILKYLKNLYLNSIFIQI